MAKSVTLPPASVAVLAFEGCSAWITAGLIELFAIANNALRHLPPRGRRPRCSRFDCRVVASRVGTVHASHGVAFTAAGGSRRYQALIVPPLWVESLQDLVQRRGTFKREHALITQLARRTRIVASCCSGAVLLADAGLLTGRRATTCWWLADWFSTQFPQIELEAERLVVKDADRWTAAAGSAYIHLGLELVRELAGEETAAMTARLMLVERKRGSQSPFLGPTPAPPADGELARALRYFDAHVSAPGVIAEACRALSMSERTLARRFHEGLGMSPLGYLQSQRVARAKRLLESGRLPLERIVEECGYSDVSSFRKLFARHVGMTPREYRSRFSAPRALSR